MTPSGCPCPRCGASSRVLRTSLGARKKKSRRDFLLRERVCTRKHRFVTEEKVRRKQ